MQIRGEIAFIDSRDVKSKKTGRTYKAYSVKLKQDDGTFSEKLDCGFEPPKGVTGDYVEVTAEQENGYWKLKSIVAATPPQRSAPAAAAGSPASSSGDNQTAPAVDRQTQIVLQHSQEIAVREVALLLAHDALPLSSAGGKAGQAKRFEELTQAVKKLTVERYFDVVTARLLDSVADAGEVDLGEVGALPPAQQNSTTTNSEDD